MELELADEDEPVPCVPYPLPPRHTMPSWILISPRYKIGDAFFHVSLEQAQEMLATSNGRIEEAIMELEDKLGTIREEMTELKVELYARFGRTINLET